MVDQSITNDQGLGWQYLKPLCTLSGFPMHCVVDQLGVIAQLFQGSDGRQHPGRLFPCQQIPGGIGRQKVVIKP